MAICCRPRVGLYLLLFCALFLEQWGIVGLDPLTARLPFYQTLSGSGGIPLPVSPLEMLLIVTLAAVALLPYMARRGGDLRARPALRAAVLFLAFVVLVDCLWGSHAGGAGPFDMRAAWEETRSFFYLGDHVRAHLQPDPDAGATADLHLALHRRDRP